MNKELNELLVEINRIIQALSLFEEDQGDLTLSQRKQLDSLFQKKLQLAIKARGENGINAKTTESHATH